MDANRFDALAKGMATSTSRRSMLGALAAGGLLSALGLKQTSSAAIGQTCTLDFAAMVRLGPSAGQVLGNGATQPGELRGELSFPIPEDGNIVDGALRLADGTTLPVVGFQAGRTLEMRIEVETEQVLVAVGVGEETIAECQGAVDGLATGPQFGDLGDWHAVARGLTGEAGGSGNPSTGTGLGATLTAVAATTTPSTTATAAPTTEATAAPTVPPGGCQAGRMACAGFCVDLQNDATNCGACGKTCGPNQGCSGGECSDVLNPGSLCRAGWTYCNGTCCSPNQGCTDGQCSDFIGNLCRTGLTDCGGTCVDISTSKAHCGACGKQCGATQVCEGGRCYDTTTGGLTRPVTCFGGLVNCGNVCVDTSSDVYNCGGCGNVCAFVPGGPVNNCVGGVCI